jgi:FAD/FMN-containing dehydrogenase
MADERVSYQENGITAIAQQYGVVPSHGLPGVDEARVLELLDEPCPEPYWKTRLKGGLREIFFLTTLDRAPAFIALMEELAARYAYPLDEVGIYIQPIQQGHTCHLEFDLFYDPSNEAEAQAAEELFLEAGAAMSEAGGFFSRPYGPWAATAYARCPDTVSALRNVKQMLDPRGVMNRGKLCFGGE